MNHQPPPTTRDQPKPNILRMGGGPIQDINKPGSVLRSITARDVLRSLCQAPAASSKAIAQRLDMDAKIIAYHVHRLERAGLIGWFTAQDAALLQVTPAAEACLSHFVTGLGPERSSYLALPAHAIGEPEIARRSRQRYRVPA